MPPPPVLLVFSHLRWGFVYQRPQHLLARLAERWRVIYVEEPVHCEGAVHLETREITSRLTVLVPHTPVAAAGFHDDQLALLQPLLDSALHALGLSVDVPWLYTPMALPLAKSFTPTCLVYDCMDELSGFKDAPRQLRQRESALLKEAAQVFTGGPSLYEARRDLHPSVHCFPNAVDAAHFSPANLVLDCDHAQMAAELQDGLPRPRLGFFGVIDERLDLDLVAAVADQHPEWAVVMAGPVVKIDPSMLPQRLNIHWLGMQPYERLPYLLAGWDLCLMPFALNEATRFISPTKTLEYMAGDKPVVSTPVRDVISLYGAAVAVAPAPLLFVQACEAVLAETAAARCKRNSEMLNTVSMHSWQRTAEAMDGLLKSALRSRNGWPLQGPERSRAPAGRSGRQSCLACGGARVFRRRFRPRTYVSLWRRPQQAARVLCQVGYRVLTARRAGQGAFLCLRRLPHHSSAAGPDRGCRLQTVPQLLLSCLQRPRAIVQIDASVGSRTGSFSPGRVGSVTSGGGSDGDGTG